MSTPLIRSIQPLARAAFGLQALGAMLVFGGVALVVIGAVGGLLTADEGALGALAFWLIAWGIAALSIAGGVAMALFGWRFSGDWITEWPGYAVGLSLGAAGDVLLALLLFATGLHWSVSLVVALGSVFGAGFAVAGQFFWLEVSAANEAEALLSF